MFIVRLLSVVDVFFYCFFVRADRHGKEVKTIQITYFWQNLPLQAHPADIRLIAMQTVLITAEYTIYNILPKRWVEFIITICFFHCFFFVICLKILNHLSTIGFNYDFN